MILREWRGRVPREKSAAYLKFLAVRAVPDYAAVPGHRNTWILLDDGPAVSEFVLLTLWDSRDAIRGFAGDDISRAPATTPRTRSSCWKCRSASDTTTSATRVEAGNAARKGK